MGKLVSSLESWFLQATQGGWRDELTVPPSVTMLPCGHTRGCSEKEFILRRKSDGSWYHGHPECKGPLPGLIEAPRNETARPVRRTSEEDGRGYQEASPYFARY